LIHAITSSGIAVVADAIRGLLSFETVALASVLPDLRAPLA